MDKRRVLGQGQLSSLLVKSAGQTQEYTLAEPTTLWELKRNNYILWLTVSILQMNRVIFYDAFILSKFDITNRASFKRLRFPNNLNTI